MGRTGLWVRAAGAAIGLAATLAAGSAFADDLPSKPAKLTVLGDYMYAQGTIQDPNYQQGQYRNGTYTYYGSGPTPLPVNGADHLSLSFGGPGNSVSLQPTVSPLGSLKVVTDATLPMDPRFVDSDIVARGDLVMIYRVDLHANSQAAADALTGMLNTSGAIASIQGKYYMDETGDGWGSVAAFTGTSEAGSLQRYFADGCSLTGYTSTGAHCNQTYGYGVALNFVPGTTYDGGSPLDFVSQIELAVAANAGPYDLGYTPGTFTAYIDPNILFNAALNPADYSLEVGGVSTDFVNGPPAGVPEPASWALMLLGLGGAGAILRSARRRAGVAAA